MMKSCQKFERKMKRDCMESIAKKEFKNAKIIQSDNADVHMK